MSYSHRSASGAAATLRHVYCCVVILRVIIARNETFLGYFNAVLRRAVYQKLLYVAYYSFLLSLIGQGIAVVLIHKVDGNLHIVRIELMQHLLPPGVKGQRARYSNNKHCGQYAYCGKGACVLAHTLYHARYGNEA